jgi:AmmeMemoRadiSam system protein B
MLRRAAVAGSWYPATPTQLGAEIDRYLAEALVDVSPRPPRAVIVPHAGLMYSGPVAAFAYKRVSGASYRAIVLVGPSHFVPFRGVSIWPVGEWETPFGAVAVDHALAHAIQAECAEVVDLPAAHGREHSLEMQLPFLAHLLPDVPIVPLVMGHQTRSTAFALGDALARVIARTSNDSNDPNVLLLASSDLSHYERASVASEMDAIMMGRVEALDSDGLMDELEREPRHACGGGPMVSVLRAARQLGASEGRVLRYADSGDVSGDKSSVVGYLAAAVQ